jgi:hypothetical protein
VVLIVDIHLSFLVLKGMLNILAIYILTDEDADMHCNSWMVPVVCSSQMDTVILL